MPLRLARAWMPSLLVLAMAISPVAGAEPHRPNIVLIYADDLGYGDVSAYGSTTIKTPQMDRLAREGLRFTQAYSTSATCTPSRYALLTGEYPWRRKGTGIAPGDANMIISPSRPTMASMLQGAGYKTGVVGKWHLGLGDGKIDWNREIRPNPNSIGFDFSMIMAATGDRVPCVYVENGRVRNLDPKDPIEVQYGKPIEGLPTGKANPELLRIHPSHGHDQTIVNGISRIGYMKGGASALWKDEDMADTFTQAALQFLEQHQKDPFFLFFALHDPHVPRVPHPRFVGSTSMGPRGDAIMQADWCVGQVLDKLQSLGLAENTLVILSSDNGPVIDDGYRDDAVEKLGSHRPSGPLRGGKYSKFEAGTRVPFLVRWPGKIQPGISDALLSQVDLFATFAKLTGGKFPQDTAGDSQELSASLLGQSTQGRSSIVLQGINTLALRRDQWKFIPGSQGAAKNPSTNTELGNHPQPQLYDLQKDIAESKNVAAEHPDVIASLQKELDAIQARPAYDQ